MRAAGNGLRRWRSLDNRPRPALERRRRTMRPARIECCVAQALLVSSSPVARWLGHMPQATLLTSSALTNMALEAVFHASKPGRSGLRPRLMEDAGRGQCRPRLTATLAWSCVQDVALAAARSPVAVAGRDTSREGNGAMSMLVGR